MPLGASWTVPVNNAVATKLHMPDTINGDSVDMEFVITGGEYSDFISHTSFKLVIDNQFQPELHV